MTSPSPDITAGTVLGEEWGHRANNESIAVAMARGMKAGNRPIDVCGLCDRPISAASRGGNASLHMYLGPGWVHGGGREHCPVHWACAAINDFTEGSPMHTSLVAAIGAF